jgi:ribosomal protein S18 acetylase RimI-like enzyme
MADEDPQSKVLRTRITAWARQTPFSSVGLTLQFASIRIASGRIRPVTKMDESQGRALLHDSPSVWRGKNLGVTYFKRYRMELDLAKGSNDPPDLPDGYFMHPWSERHIAAHADVKFRSFREEIDVHVFPCFGEREGCQRLMCEIAQRDGFLASATWLLEYRPIHSRRGEFCGTIQGIRDSYGMGAVQNIGIVPEHRGRSLGSALLLQALIGFRKEGLRRASLEVTAQNTGAMRLYHRLGFRKTKTVYKAAEVVYV